MTHTTPLPAGRRAANAGGSAHADEHFWVRCPRCQRNPDIRVSPAPAARPGPEAVRARHYSRRTEKAYVAWTRRYVLFHGKRHPIEMGAAEVGRFLTSLATEAKVAASTQNQALNALLFLYRVVLEQDLPWLNEVVRARRPQHLPVVLSREEVRVVLDRLDGTPRLMALLLYGAGLRLLECARLRVKDVDFASSQILVRSGKGARDRVTMLPAAARPALLRHLQGTRRRHDDDLRRGAGWVEILPPFVPFTNEV